MGLDPRSDPALYKGGTSPLATTMDRYAGFFTLFGSFDGYVDHFLLGDS